MTTLFSSFISDKVNGVVPMDTTFSEYENFAAAVVVPQPKKAIVPGAVVGTGVGALATGLGVSPIIDGVTHKLGTHLNQVAKDDIAAMEAVMDMAKSGTSKIADYRSYLDANTLDQATSNQVMNTIVGDGIGKAITPVLGGAAIGTLAGMGTNALVNKYRQNKFLKRV